MNKIRLPLDSALLDADFTFGVATSSFQIEGAAEQRLPSIWDSFCEKPSAIADGSNGLVACDHFHLWQQDIDLVASLGVDAYRFSIAWPRVIYADGSLNQDGVAFYRDILDYLAVKGLKAFVTLYHWDLPQHLEDKGGWLSRETSYAFKDYAALMSKELGDKVFSWATLNEPFCSAYLGYELGTHAPGKTGCQNGRHAAHHLLLAHGLAMQVLRENCPDAELGVVLNLSPCYPATQSEEDIAAAAMASEYLFEWFLSPLINGTYPPVIDLLEPADRPVIEDGDMDIIAAEIDWYGINYYTREVYQASPDMLFEKVHSDAFPLTDMGWEVYPQGLTELICALGKKYTLPPLYITENGAAMPDRMRNAQVDDPDRINYLNDHINAVDAAMRESVDIRGYFAWSLMDNFEWAEGYKKRFGIVYVDYETLERTIKASGLEYRNFLVSRQKEVAA